jgi:hypothetical protein
MNTLDLFTEPYGSTGNIGENFLRLLGAPNTDALQTVIREAVQNIADAAKLGVGPEVLIRLRRLDDQQMQFMRNRVLVKLPEEAHSKANLKRFLDQDNPVVLEICDFQTTGLGGPTRADRIPIGTKRTDFINFLRNIGTPRDTDHGGGTYGFGKAALYSVSRCQTIFVDTYIEDDGVSERRLIGCHVGSRFERAEDGMLRQFTGRHWWGESDKADGIADPALNDFAEELASGIGFPERGPRQTGTSIMMIDFHTDDDDLVSIGNRIVEGLLWSFWPRMMRDTPESKRFNCRVFAGHEELEIPCPENFPPLELFCDAMRMARSGQGNGFRAIASQRPTKHLGNLAIRTGLRAARRRLTEESLFPAVAHHIALMRPVELVVKYLKGPPFPSDQFEWAGVFLVDGDDEVERAFALAEPPAHDDWVPANMEKGVAKTYVRVALDRLQQAALEMGSTVGSRVGGGADGPPLAKVAGRLGTALLGVTGDGAGVRRRDNRQTLVRVLRPTASRPMFAGLTRRDDRTVAMFMIDVRQDAAKSGERLKVTAAIAVEGSASKFEEFATSPCVLSIRADGSSIASDNDTIELRGLEGRFAVEVTVPQDCAVTLDAEILTGQVA